MTKQNKIFKVKALTDMATVHGKVKCGDVLAVVISNYPIMDLGAMMTATGRVVVEDCSEEEADLDALIDPADMPANTTRTQPPQPPLEEPPGNEEDDDELGESSEADTDEDETPDGDSEASDGSNDGVDADESEGSESSPLPEILATLQGLGVSEGTIGVLRENSVTDGESLAELISRPKVKGIGTKRREEIDTALKLLKEGNGDEEAEGEKSDGDESAE